MSPRCSREEEGSGPISWGKVSLHGALQCSRWQGSKWVSVSSVKQIGEEGMEGAPGLQVGHSCCTFPSASLSGFILLSPACGQSHPRAPGGRGDGWWYLQGGFEAGHLRLCWTQAGLLLLRLGASPCALCPVPSFACTLLRPVNLPPPPILNTPVLPGWDRWGCSRKLNLLSIVSSSFQKVKRKSFHRPPPTSPSKYDQAPVPQVSTV